MAIAPLTQSTIGALLVVAAIGAAVFPQPLRSARLLSVEATLGVLVAVVGATTSAIALPAPWNFLLCAIITSVGLIQVFIAERRSIREHRTKVIDASRRGWQIFRRIEDITGPVVMARFNVEQKRAEIGENPTPEEREDYRNLTLEFYRQRVIAEHAYRRIADDIYFFLAELRDQFGMKIDRINTLHGVGSPRFNDMYELRNLFAQMLHALMNNKVTF